MAQANSIAAERGVFRGCVFNRRCWWLLLALWTGVVGTSLWLSLAEVQRHNLQLAAEGARNMFRMVLLTRRWNARHGGVYVPVDASVQPNPYLQHPQRDVTTGDGTPLTLINPAYMTRPIAEIASDQGGVQFHITSLQPIRPANAADSWETTALQAFERDVPEVMELVEGAKERQFRYMAPLPVVSACLKCHGIQGYAEGDIRGGISVSQNYAPFDAAAEQARNMELGKHLVVYLLVGAGGWWLLEMLRRRWTELEENIQALHLTRDELVQSEKMASLGRMVAGFAHEVNTPVGVAVGAASHGEEAARRLRALLQQEEVHEDDLLHEIDVVSESSALTLSNLRRAADLVQSFKRTSVDQTSEHPRDFNYRELIGDVVTSLHNRFKRTAIRFHVDCPEDLKISGIPGVHSQLLTNLIMNSYQHAFAAGTLPGEIRIAVAKEAGEQLRIDYADDGAGMAPDVLPRIFEPFFTTDRSGGGSGLGMYICYNLVTRQLGGTIEARSAPGEGVRFGIRYPLNRTEAKESRP